MTTGWMLRAARLSLAVVLIFGGGLALSAAEGYQPLTKPDYIRIAADLIERTPEEVIFHRVTATASPDILLAPMWCAEKWNVLNGIEQELRRRGSRQGRRAGTSFITDEILNVA